MTTDWDERTEAIPGQKGDKSFELELEFGAPAAEEDPGETLVVGDPRLGHKSVVVFEPTPLGLAAALANLGYLVRAGATGVDVMGLVAGQQPALVVCAPAPDPERRRLLAAALRLRFPSIPVLYVSTHAGQEEAVLGAIREGARAVIAWPLPPAADVARVLGPYLARSTPGAARPGDVDDDDAIVTPARPIQRSALRPPDPAAAASSVRGASALGASALGASAPGASAPGVAPVAPDSASHTTAPLKPAPRGAGTGAAVVGATGGHAPVSAAAAAAAAAATGARRPSSTAQPGPAHPGPPRAERGGASLPPRTDLKKKAPPPASSDAAADFDDANTDITEPPSPPIDVHAPMSSIGRVSSRAATAAPPRRTITPAPAPVPMPMAMPIAPLPVPVPLPVALPREEPGEGRPLEEPATQPNMPAAAAAAVLSSSAANAALRSTLKRGEIGSLLSAVSPFLWSLEDAARWADELAAAGDPAAKNHARALHLLAKILVQLQNRIDDLGA